MFNAVLRFISSWLEQEGQPHPARVCCRPSLLQQNSNLSSLETLRLGLQVGVASMELLMPRLGLHVGVASMELLISHTYHRNIDNF